MLGLSLVSVSLAFLVPPNIFWITYFAGTVFASSWGPVAFMSVWSPRITERAAFWGIVAGFAGNIGANLLGMFELVELPVYLDPIFLGAAASLAAIWGLSRHGDVSEAERAFLAALHRTPEGERDARRVRRSLVWPKAMLAVGIALSAAMIAFYARPYQEAVGAAGAVASGELLLAVAQGTLLIAGAALAHWGVRRAYAAGPAGPASRPSATGSAPG